MLAVVLLWKFHHFIFGVDWTTTEKHKIDLKEIIGFIIHWRGDSWHIEVKTKEKISEYEYRSYELSQIWW